MKRIIRNIVLYQLLMATGPLYAESISCPARREGKRLTNAVFYEWTSTSSTRTMANDRMTLAPDESRTEGDDWFQTWNITPTISQHGLQMICQYQGVRSGLFFEVSQPVSVCTLTKKSGVVAVGRH